jgi:hypothetical protein
MGLFVWMIIMWYGMTMPNYRRSISATLFHRFCWGMAGGSVSGLQNFLKDALTIIHDTKYAATVTWYLYVLLLLALAAALGGLLLLTASMKRYDATFSAAMFVGAYIVSASIMSAVHYHTFDNLSHSSWNYTMYPTGLVILLSGVIILVHDTDDDHSAVIISAESPRVMENLNDAYIGPPNSLAPDDDARSDGNARNNLVPVESSSLEPPTSDMSQTDESQDSLLHCTCPGV